MLGHAVDVDNPEAQRYYIPAIAAYTFSLGRGSARDRAPLEGLPPRPTAGGVVDGLNPPGS